MSCTNLNCDSPHSLTHSLGRFTKPGRYRSLMEFLPVSLNYLLVHVCLLTMCVSSNLNANYFCVQCTIFGFPSYHPFPPKLEGRIVPIRSVAVAGSIIRTVYLRIYCTYPNSRVVWLYSIERNACHVTSFMCDTVLTSVPKMDFAEKDSKAFSRMDTRRILNERVQQIET